jgi:hypothetical protein
MDWRQALAWADGFELAGYSDWRLPNAKELQSLVDYSHAPAYDGQPAIDPVFECTPITAEDGYGDFACYWTSTTHLDGMNPGGNGCYVAFGRAMGYLGHGWTDVHGAGAQRSDPKQGDPATLPYAHGPQGDAVRVYNMVRLVRDAR